MTLLCDEKLAASRPSQIQPTGNNPSLLPIHITLPPDFTEAFTFVSNFVFVFVFLFLYSRRQVCQVSIGLWFVSVD